MLATLVLLGAISTASFADGGAPPPMCAAHEWIILQERSARFLQVCLLIVAIAMMSRLGLTWHHYSLGIAAGFGVYSAWT
jgi:hypothetical protein